MAKKTKKVILFIVEGPTEEDALSPILKKIFQNEEVHFRVVHGDITTDRGISSTNAIKTVNIHIKSELERYGFRRSDILKVIHLIDTDGAFIPDTHVIAGDVEKLHYEQEQIISPSPQATKERNRTKASVVKRLYQADKIAGSPYSVYYSSRNMEHVLHNVSGDLTDDEKMNYADGFADKYAENPEAFIHFLSDSSFTVPGNYLDSWRFIFLEANSLHRYCNIHILFQST